MTRIGLAICLAVLLGGCISNMPVDLEVVSIQAVDWRDQDELPGPGASPILGMVSTRTLALYGQSVTGGPKPSRLLLKIEFASATNLSKFVTDNSYSLGSSAFACNRPADAFIGLSYVTIFWRGFQLGQYETDPIERHKRMASDPITYYFFINVARVRPPRPDEEDFDLRQNPQDICFVVRGGNNSGFGYRSNTVVIPKATIIAALQNLPTGFHSN